MKRLWSFKKIFFKMLIIKNMPSFENSYMILQINDFMAIHGDTSDISFLIMKNFEEFKKSGENVNKILSKFLEIKSEENFRRKIFI